MAATAQIEEARPARLPIVAGSPVQAIVPSDFAAAYRMAEMVFECGLAPASYKNAGQVAVGILYSLELGFTPMAGLRSIAVINGVPSVWGTGALGLVESSGLLEEKEETQSGTPFTDNWTFTCKVKRKGRPLVSKSFSVKQAKTAMLWGKPGPWQQYPDRMLQMKARGLALNDEFSDVLRGLPLAEDQMDVAMHESPPAPPPPPPPGKKVEEIIVDAVIDEQAGASVVPGKPPEMPTPANQNAPRIEPEDAPADEPSEPVAPVEPPAPPAPPPPPPPPPAPSAAPAQDIPRDSIESDFDFARYLAKADQALMACKTPMEVEDRWAKRVQPPRILKASETRLLVDLKARAIERCMAGAAEPAPPPPPAPAPTVPRAHQAAGTPITTEDLESAKKRGRLAAAAGKSDVVPDDIVDNDELRIAWSTAYRHHLETLQK